MWITWLFTFAYRGIQSPAPSPLQEENFFFTSSHNPWIPACKLCNLIKLEWQTTPVAFFFIVVNARKNDNIHKPRMKEWTYLSVHNWNQKTRVYWSIFLCTLLLYSRIVNIIFPRLCNFNKCYGCCFASTKINQR